MRQIKKLTVPPVRRKLLTVFNGYHHRSVIDSGECFDMQNLTSNDYPLLSVRKARYSDAYLDGSPMQECIALHSRSDHPVVCNIFGNIFCGGHYLGGLLRTENGRVPASLLPKKIVSMGAWCVIFPDKVYFNAVKLGNGDEMAETEDYGYLEKQYDSDDYIVSGVPISITIQPCKPDGTWFSDLVSAETAPEAPQDGDYWRDISNFPYVIRQWNAEPGTWNEIESLTSVLCEGIDTDALFAVGDHVQISCFSGTEQSAKVGGQDLPCEIRYIANRQIIVSNLYVNKTHHTVTDLTRVTVRTVVPDMDYVVECGNRLWGCYYGVADGERINEIYACKLGDFRNWQSYRGISTDSYTASRGAEGEFTGAAVLGDTPLFFRESSFEKVFPEANGAHRILTVYAPGIQKGSWQSALVVRGVLYYKGTDGIYTYTGSVPQNISYKLGDTFYSDAVAGLRGSKYYISMRDSTGLYHLFVFDAMRGLWHKEDNTRFYYTAAFDGELYFEDGSGRAQKIDGADNSTNVPWMAQSGLIGLTMPDQKRIGRLDLRLQLEIGAQARISVQYDSDGHWHEKARLHGNTLHTVNVPIVPVRCDHLQLKLSGIGGMKLYSVCCQIEQGSDVS